MHQLLAIAIGGSFGAVLRFLVSSGIYQWLGKGFPYGTLFVNISGSFLLGLLTEALILNRIVFAQDYRSAILVGFIGAFTTFSTFSLETIYLIVQGEIAKASLNIVLSVSSCLLAVGLGLFCGKTLSTGHIYWSGGLLPYALIAVNVVVAFLLVFIMTILMVKAPIATVYQLALIIILVGLYLTLSGLYVVLYLLEYDDLFKLSLMNLIPGFICNTIACLLSMWFGLLAGKQFLKFF